MKSRRIERVAEELRAEIARVLREEVADPRVALVTRAARRRLARPAQRAGVLEPHRAQGRPGRSRRSKRGLASAAGFLRRRLAQELPLKRMPALSFRYDAAIEAGDRTLALLRELSDEPTE